MSEEPLCFCCRRALPSELDWKWQWTDGDQAGAEVVLTCTCPFCGELNEVIIWGTRLGISTTDPEECRDRVSWSIGSEPVIEYAEPSDGRSNTLFNKAPSKKRKLRAVKKKTAKKTSRASTKRN